MRIIMLCIGFALSFLLLSKFSSIVFDPVLFPEQINDVTFTEGKEIKFPLHLNNSSLQIIRLVSYDGPYTEDGTDEEVIGVAALEIHNASELFLKNCSVELQMNGHHYKFIVYALPPFSKVLVLENERKPYVNSEMISYSADLEFEKKSSTDYLITDIRDKRILAVENCSDEVLEKVEIWYKTFDKQSQMYIGGIAYSIYIEQLLPGQHSEYEPFHLAAGYSKIVAKYSQ